MNPFDWIRGRLFAIAGIAAIAVLAWGLRVDHLRAGWKTHAEASDHKIGVIVEATRQASDNPKLSADNVPGQILALGDDKRQLRISLEDTNATIAQMAREAVRLRAKNAELSRLADKAEAQRSAALSRLSDLRATPGTRSDCEILLKEANEALDIIREASRVQATPATH